MRHSDTAEESAAALSANAKLLFGIEGLHSVKACHAQGCANLIFGVAALKNCQYLGIPRTASFGDDDVVARDSVAAVIAWLEGEMNVTFSEGELASPSVGVCLFHRDIKDKTAAVSEDAPNITEDQE